MKNDICRRDFVLLFRLIGRDSDNFDISIFHTPMKFEQKIHTSDEKVRET